MSQHKIKLAIVDDHPIIIEGLLKLLSKLENIDVIGSFTNGTDFLYFLKETPVQVVLLDITLPDINGMDLCEKIKLISPETFVLALSNHNERSIIMKMLQNGASGYLLKNASVDELTNCINEALRGQITFSPAVNDIILRPQIHGFSEVAKLTKREKEVLQLIASGKTTINIAEELFLSKLTIESHRKNLLQKFKVKNVAELIKTAIQQDFL